MEMITPARLAIRFGRFTERTIESNFRTYELDAGYRSLSLILPLLGAIFLGFSLPDLFVLRQGGCLTALFLARLAFFIASVAAPRFLRSDVALAMRELVLGAVTVYGIAVFGLAMFVYRDGNFYLQAMSVLLMVTAQSLVPNRFSVSVTISLVIVAIGVVSVESRAETMPAMTKAALLVDSLLMTLISSIIWLRACRSRRREYIKFMELEHISRTDPLTGLGNRRYLADRFTEAQSRSARYGETYALILVDLDRFKNLNDNFGHEAGDDALKETSKRFSAALRSEDSISRWGGEEFVILLSYATVDAALESAKRLRLVLSSTPMTVVGTVTASFGITLLRSSEALADAVARADLALYRAKDAGRDRVEFEP
jgi:diguanylate cyclase (GGDEF)-like protein